MSISDLSIRTTTAASVTPTPGGGFSLRLPAGDASAFRLAQLDDCKTGPRSHLRWSKPASLRLRAKVSSLDHSGTWGFGLWNDPFSISLGIQGSARRLPALPDAAWFFFASKPNHLSLRNDRPGKGFLAATFSSPAVPSLLLAPGLLAIPLLAWKRASRGLRGRLSSITRGDSRLLEMDPTAWADYGLSWTQSGVTFSVDGSPVFETSITPRGPLGLVIWVDNQFAAWSPDGAISSGMLAGEKFTLDIEDLQLGES